MKYLVVFEAAEHNFAAYVPDVPGCVATSRTRDEVERRVRSALAIHVSELGRHQEPVPRPSAWAREIEVEGGVAGP